MGLLLDSEILGDRTGLIHICTSISNRVPGGGKGLVNICCIGPEWQSYLRRRAHTRKLRYKGRAVVTRWPKLHITPAVKYTKTLEFSLEVDGEVNKK